MCRYPRTDASILQHNHLGNGEYTITQLAFSSSEKLLYTFSEIPDEKKFTLSVWSVENSMLINCFATTCSIHNLECYSNSKSSVFGISNDKLMIYSYKRKLQKTIERDFDIYNNYEKANHQNLVAFYFNHKVYFMFKAYDNLILIYYKAHVLQSIKIDQEFLKNNEIRINSESFKISSICYLNGLLLVGFSGLACVFIFHISKNNFFVLRNFIIIPVKGIFLKTTSIEIAEDSSLVGLSVVCQRSFNIEDKTPIQTTIELFEIDSFILEAINYSSTESIRPLHDLGTFSNGVIDASISQCNDLIVGLSRDKFLKVMNYQNRDEISSIVLPRKALCLDIHPSGFQIAVGFKEGLKIYFSTVAEIKEVNEKIGKECLSIKYSERGDFLGATSGNLILVIDPYSTEVIFQFQMHMTSAKDIYWRGNDSVLVSLCQNGNIFAWETKSFTKTCEFYFLDRSVSILASDYDPVLDLLVIGTSNSRISMFYDKCSIEIVNDSIFPLIITNLLICRKIKVLFAGTSKGLILMFTWPLVVTKEKIEYIITPLHQQAINKILISPKNDVLITASNDSTIFVSKIYSFLDDVEDKTHHQKNFMTNLKPLEKIENDINQRSHFVEENENTFIENFESEVKFGFNFQEFVLLNTKLEKEKKEVMKDLSFQIDNLKNEIEEQNAHLSTQNKNTRTNVDDMKKDILKSQKMDLENDMESKEKQHMQFLAEKSQNLKDFDDKYELYMNEYEGKMINLYNKQDELNEIYLKELENFTNRVSDLNKLTLSQQKTIEDEKGSIINELKSKFINASNQQEFDRHKFEETLLQMSDEYTIDFGQQQQLLETEVILAKKRVEDYKLSNTKLLKDNQKHIQKQNELKNLIYDANNQNEIMKKEANLLKNVVDRIQGQLNCQEIVINLKEDKLSTFRRKNEFLASKQEVLNFLIANFETQINKLEDYLVYLNKNLSSINSDLFFDSDECKKLQYVQESLGHEIQNVFKKIQSKNMNLKNNFFLAKKLIAMIMAFCSDHELKEPDLKKHLLEVFSSPKFKVVTSFMEDKDRAEEFKKSKQIVLKAQNLMDKQNCLLPPIETINNLFPKKSENDNVLNATQTKFNHELFDLKNKFKKKLIESREKYSELVNMRQISMNAIQTTGACLIKQSSDLKNEKFRVFQSLMNQKNESQKLMIEMKGPSISRKSQKEIKRKQESISQKLLKSDKNNEAILPKYEKKLTPLIDSSKILRQAIGWLNKQKVALKENEETQGFEVFLDEK